MVEKRVFDTILSNFLRNDPSIRVIALVDNEGLPISFAIKSRKYKIKPNTLGATIKQGFYPLENYAKNLQLDDPIIQMYLMEDGILVIINLKIAILGILFDNSGWPLQKNLFQNLFSKLQPQLEKSIGQEDSLLSKITGEGNRSVATNGLTDQFISKTLEIFDSFQGGEIAPLLIMDSAPAPEIFSNVSEKFDSFMVDSQSNILSMNPNYGPEFVATTKETLDIEVGGLKGFKSGSILAGISYYSNGACLINGIMGEHQDKNIYLFKKYNDWTIGFNSMISPFYAVANYLVADFASEESMNFIDVIIYLTDSISSLKERINSYIESKDLPTARKFMERAAILSIRKNNLVEAGDLYKWIGFTHYQDGNVKEASAYYDKAGKTHENGRDYAKAGADYFDLANILNNSHDIDGAIQNYIKATELYSKINDQAQINEINALKKQLLAPYYQQVDAFVKQSSSAALTIDYIAQKIKVNELITVQILQDLIEEGKIGGEVDAQRGRYTKTRISSKSPTKPVKESAKISQGSSIGISYTQLQPEFMKVESALQKMESEFESKNLPFLKYLDYEKLLDKKQYLEHKSKILEEQNTFFDGNNMNKKCYICFKDITPNDNLVECPNGHKAHQTCMSIWIKSQDACPICDSPLFPYVIRKAYYGIQGSSGSNTDNSEILDQMKAKIADLEQKLANMEGINKTLKEIKGDNQGFVEKIMRERDLKSKLEKELKRKDLTIRELKSMIKLFKQ